MLIMKKALFCLTVLAIAMGFDSSAPAATKVFLLGGQSNMAGLGAYSGYLGDSAPETQPPYNVADDPCPAPYNSPQPEVKFWNYYPDSISNSIHNPGTGNGWDSTRLGYGYRTDQFGPELSFAYRLNQLNPNDDIYLVKYGISGTTLAEDWNPNGTGLQYNTFKARVNAALANLTAAHKDPQIAGMIWMQGESDAIESHSFALNYETNLETFIGKVRTDFGVSDMKFVLGRITTYYGPSGDNALVRAAQDDIPHRVSNVVTISTDGLEWAYRGHYGTDGQIQLGTRFADEFTPVPEPSALVLAGSVLLPALAILSRRNRRKSGYNTSITRF
jgi:hypothetical protein